MENHPKLRSDLIIMRRGTAEDGAVYVAKSPTTGRYFRFQEAERFITRQLDGSTPLEVIRQRAEEEFQSPLSRAALERFVEVLRRLGLLEGGSNGARPRSRIRGSLLYLRLKALDPDSFLDRLLPRVRWLFTRPFAVLSAGLIAVALGIALANGATIARGFPRLGRVDILVLIWVTLVAITVIHELAHGITCKHFGGSVHEMGFLLLYFQPAMYCNVSDAWLLPEKWKRLWVTFAGAYVELCFWALATIVWRLTEPATAPNQLALVVMVTLGIKTLFNLNPLIKLDGYYLLCDFLEIPNLRRRAFQYIGSRLGHLRGSTGQGFQEPTRRERRVYLVYAVLAAAFSLWLLGLVSSYAARSLVGRYQGWGFLAFTGLMLTVFRGPLRTAGSRFASAIQRLRNVKAGMSRSQKQLALLALLVAALLLVPVDLKVAGEFSILPARNADVRADVEGTIEQVFVREGDVVAKGDPLARLSDRDYRAELEKTRLEIAEKSAKRNMLVHGATRAEIDLAKATVAKAKERLGYSQH